MGNTYFDVLRKEFAGFGQELLAGIRQNAADREDKAAENAAEYQWQLGVEKAVAAMLDLNIPDEKIVAMLQKHWDFRLSEATDYVKGYKSWKSKHE